MTNQNLNPAVKGQIERFYLLADAVTRQRLKACKTADEELSVISDMFGGQTLKMPYLDPLSERGRHKARLAAAAPLDPSYKLSDEFIQGLNPLVWQAANSASMNHPRHQSLPAHQRDELVRFLQAQIDRQAAIVQLLQAANTNAAPPAAQSSHHPAAAPTPAPLPDAPAPAPAPPASAPL